MAEYDQPMQKEANLKMRARVLEERCGKLEAALSDALDRIRKLEHIVGCERAEEPPLR